MPAAVMQCNSLWQKPTLRATSHSLSACQHDTEPPTSPLQAGCTWLEHWGTRAHAPWCWPSRTPPAGRWLLAPGVVTPVLHPPHCWTPNSQCGCDGSWPSWDCVSTGSPTVCTPSSAVPAQSSQWINPVHQSTFTVLSADQSTLTSDVHWLHSPVNIHIRCSLTAQSCQHLHWIFTDRSPVNIHTG